MRACPKFVLQMFSFRLQLPTKKLETPSQIGSSQQHSEFSGRAGGSFSECVQPGKGYLLEFKDTTSSQSLLDPNRLCRFLCPFYFNSSCQPTMTSTTTSPTLAVATLSEFLPMMIAQKRSLLFLNRFDSKSFGIFTVNRGDLSITTCRFHGISQTYDFSLFTFNQECVLHYTSLQSWEATIHGWKDFQTQKNAHSIHFESASSLGSQHLSK